MTEVGCYVGGRQHTAKNDVGHLVVQIHSFVYFHSLSPNTVCASVGLCVCIWLSVCLSVFRFLAVMAVWLYVCECVWLSMCV